MLPLSAKEVVEVAGFRVRVPDARTRAGAQRDLMAEGIKTASHIELLAVLTAAQLSVSDSAFVKSVSEDLNRKMEPEEWLRLWNIASGVPAAAAITADWQFQQEMRRVHLIRHHLLLDGHPECDVSGRPMPLPMIALNDLTDDEKATVADKIVEMIDLTKAVSRP